MTSAEHHSHDHDSDDQPRKTYISREELNKTQIPLRWRDYCAHLVPDLMACRKASFYAPWACEKEQVAWNKCQYDDYVRRMKKLEKQMTLKKQALEEEASQI